MGDVHFRDVGVQEKGPGFLLLCGVLMGVLVGGVPLDHGTAVEFFVGVVVANCPDFFSYPVVRVSKHDCAGEEGFFVALAHGALAEERVVVVWAEDVVVGC